jgi:signal transduction histidine kinase
MNAIKRHIKVFFLVYIVSFVVLVLAVLYGNLLISSRISEEKNMAIIINESGRERMLFQKILSLVAELNGENVATKITEIKFNVEYFYDVHMFLEEPYNLVNKASKDGLAMPLSEVLNVEATLYSFLKDQKYTTDRIIKLYYGADSELDHKIYKFYISNIYYINEILSAKDKIEDLSDMLSQYKKEVYIFKDSNFSNLLNELVLAYQEEARFRLDKITNLNYLVLTVILLMLLLELIVVVVPFYRIIIINFKKMELYQSELERSRDLAQTATRAKTNFLAAMSHELRTPLNSIIGFSDIMKSKMAGELTPVQDEYMDLIRYSSASLLTLINNILDLSKMELKESTLTEELFDLSALLEHALRLVLPQTADKNLVFQNTILHPIILKADKASIERVLLNVLSNAVKYTKPNTTIDITFTGDHLGKCWVSIKDHGDGLTEDEIKQAFNPFTTIKNVYNATGESLGLGLPLAEKIMHIHGGSLNISSMKYAYTDVRLHFPCSRLARCPKAGKEFSCPNPQKHLAEIIDKYEDDK